MVPWRTQLKQKDYQHDQENDPISIAAQMRALAFADACTPAARDGADVGAFYLNEIGQRDTDPHGLLRHELQEIRQPVFSFKW